MLHRRKISMEQPHIQQQQNYLDAINHQEPTVTRLTRCDAFPSVVTLIDFQIRVRPRLARSPALYQSPRNSTLVPALIRSTKFNLKVFSIQVARWIERNSRSAMIVARAPSGKHSLNHRSNRCCNFKSELPACGTLTQPKGSARPL